MLFKDLSTLWRPRDFSLGELFLDITLDLCDSGMCLRYPMNLVTFCCVFSYDFSLSGLSKYCYISL